MVELVEVDEEPSGESRASVADRPRRGIVEAPPRSSARQASARSGPRPRPARPTARRSRSGAGARGRAARAPGRAGAPGCASSTRTPRPRRRRPPSSRAAAPCRAPGAGTAERRDVRGDARRRAAAPISCEPQRGCSFGARSPPFSYVPIETCSAPWYAARPGPRSASGRRQERDRRGRDLPASGRQRRSGGCRARPSSTPRSSRAPPAARTGSAPAAARRRTSGSSANASASATGPRRTGIDTRRPGEARLAAGGDAKRRRPRRERRAAHEVGPCTSTPFCSAIPPRRTVSFCAAPSASVRR